MPLVRHRPVGRMIASVVAPALLLSVPACSRTAEVPKVPDAAASEPEARTAEERADPFGSFASAFTSGASKQTETPKDEPAPAPPAVSVATTKAATPAPEEELEPAAAVPAPTVAAPAPAPAVAAKRAVPSGRPMSTAEIVEKCEPSVALVRGKLGTGTGFVIGPGLVATNYHVVDDEFIDALEVRFPSADEKSRGPARAALLYSDAKRDLAILAVKTALPPLEIAPVYDFRKGEDITVIGNPGMGDDSVLENAISRGIMSTKTVIEGQPYYQLNIAINPGNSGGPVFDSMGRVIGVATLKSAKQEGMAFSIPVDDLNAAVAKVAAKPGTPIDGAPSKHRAMVAFKRLASGGAVLAVGLDVHRLAFRAPGSGLQIGEKRLSIADFDKVLADLDARAFGPAAAEANAMKNDKVLAPSKLASLGKLAANYTAMRSLIVQPGGDVNAFANRARGLKENHARIVEELGKALDTEVPAGLLATLRSDNVSDPGNALAGLAQRSTGRLRDPFGTDPRARMEQHRDDARKRMQDMRDRMDQRRQQSRGRR